MNKETVNNNTDQSLDSTSTCTKYIGSLHIQHPQPNLFYFTSDKYDLLLNRMLLDTTTYPTLDTDNSKIGMGTSYMSEYDTLLYNNTNSVFAMNRPFYADNICSLSHFIQHNTFSIQTATCMLSTLYNQYQLISSKNYSISYIDLDDIMVIDSTQFLFVNCHKLYKLTNKARNESHKNEIHTNESHKKNDIHTNESLNNEIHTNLYTHMYMYIIEWYDRKNIFLPPEFIHNKQLPFYCHKSSCLYSLALVVLYCLNRNNPCIPTSLLDSTQDVLSYYKDTRIFHTLSYCLNDDPVKREFILF